MDSLRFNRRRFIHGAAGAVAAAHIVPGEAWGADGGVAASERITVGAIGTGGRGSALVRSLLPASGVQIVAVCDPHENRRNSIKQDVEAKYAERSNKGEYSGCAAYNDFRELVARQDIDAVTVASPGHWHGVHSLAALRSGKDVYCEKPLTRTLVEGRTLVDTVRRYRRVFQTGTQQRSDPRFRFACELALNGYLGAVHAVKVGAPGGAQRPPEPEIPIPKGFDYNMWVGPAPMIPYTEHRCANTWGWMQCYNFVIGFISGWGVHFTDIAVWGMGEKHAGRVEVEGTGTLPEGGLNDTWLTWLVDFTYDNGLKLSFSNNDNPHRMGCRFDGDQGWVFVNRQTLEAEPASLLDVQLKPDDVHLVESANHPLNFIECVKNRREPVSPVESGHAATTICNVADIMLRVNRKVVYDLTDETFIDDEYANRMRSRAMRSPWSV